ncbi:MAG: hypothetical protein ACREHV_02915, partial [Rhizomicrobium sp.]
ASHPLTRAQRLAAALKSCRKAHKHSRQKRLSCERQARKKYAAKKRAKHTPAKHATKGKR